MLFWYNKASNSYINNRLHFGNCTAKIHVIDLYEISYAIAPAPITTQASQVQIDDADSSTDRGGEWGLKN